MDAKHLPVELNFLAPIAGLDLIRLGVPRDGGYVVVKNSVLEADILISMGIDTDWSFDEDFIQLNPKVVVHGYDHTFSERIFKIRLRKSIQRFASFREGFSPILESYELLKRYQNFFKGNHSHFQERVHSRQEYIGDATVEKMMERAGSKKIFFKIDIEGSEYRIINDIVRYAHRISGIAIEFHDTDHLRLVFCDAVQKLLKEFHIAHIHGNNASRCAADGLPDALEITFVRNSLVPQGSSKQKSLPLSGLDFPNRQNVEDYVLRFNL